MTTKRITMPKLARRATFRAQSFDETENTVDVVWTTGASVRRCDPWSGDEFDEVLSLAPGAVRLDRLNLGAPFLDTHDSTNLSSVIGSVVPGSASIEGGRGIATVCLSKSPGVADTVQKIREGVIRNVSVGYWVHAYDETEENGVTVRTATDWEPLEISPVPIPADAGSQIRSSGTRGSSCVVTTRNASERARVAEITEKGKHAGFPSLARNHVRSGTSAARFTDILLDRLAKRHTAEQAAQREDTMSNKERDYGRGAAEMRKLLKGGTETPEKREDRQKDKLMLDLHGTNRGADEMSKLLKKAGRPRGNRF